MTTPWNPVTLSSRISPKSNSIIPPFLSEKIPICLYHRSTWFFHRHHWSYLNFSGFFDPNKSRFIEPLPLQGSPVLEFLRAKPIMPATSEILGSSHDNTLELCYHIQKSLSQPKLEHHDSLLPF